MALSVDDAPRRLGMVNVGEWSCNARAVACCDAGDPVVLVVVHLSRGVDQPPLVVEREDVDVFGIGISGLVDVLGPVVQAPHPAVVVGMPAGIIHGCWSRR